MARLMAVMIGIFDPDAIILGGGMSNIDRFYKNIPSLIKYTFSNKVETKVLKNLHGDSKNGIIKQLKKEIIMSAGYVIAQLKVTNPENYKEYVAKVTEVVKKFGGEYLVRNGEYQVVEGEDNFPRLVIIKFPSYEKALEWYHSDEYKPVKDIRLQNSEGSNIIVKGI